MSAACCEVPSRFPTPTPPASTTSADPVAAAAGDAAAGCDAAVVTVVAAVVARLAIATGCEKGDAAGAIMAGNAVPGALPVATDKGAGREEAIPAEDGADGAAAAAAAGVTATGAVTTACGASAALPSPAVLI